MAKRLLTFLMMLVVLGALGTVAGCNTVAGAGKDIERGGEKIQDESKEVQKKL
jgi:entericidin B